MTFPRLAIATLAAMCFLLLATPATAATATPQVKQASKAKIAPPTGKKKSKTPPASTDPVITIDSLRSRPAMARLIDSLRNTSADSVRRLLETARRANSDTAGLRRLQRVLDSLQRFANTNQGAIDSARRASDSVQRRTDSLRHVADSVRRIDSTTAALRTWYVSIPMGLNISRPYATYLRERLVVELRRTGRVRALTGIDTGSWSEGIWPAARASGAGRILATTLGTDSTGGIACMVRLYDLAQGLVIDSARLDATSSSTSHSRTLARKLVASLSPSPKDSACRADSLRQARTVWAISVTPSEMRDTLGARAVLDSILASVRRDPWISPASFAIPQSCSTSVCQDSIANNSGASLVLRAFLGRQIDSAWFLRSRLHHLGDGTTSDSFLVTDEETHRLASRLSTQIRKPPASCPQNCPPHETRSVWMARIVADSTNGEAATTLGKLLTQAFRLRTDRQFLASPRERGVADSTARLMGASRLATATLSGLASMWTLTTTIRDTRTGQIDTFTLRRGGPRSRILPWMARHLAAFGSKVEICQNPCRIDSVQRSNAVWAIAGGSDSLSNRILDAVTNAFPASGRGRIVRVAFPDSCNTPVCIDSLATTHSIDRTLWPTFARGKDSAWMLSAKVADMATDAWTDSVTIRDKGVLAESANSFWKALNPSVVCDSCVDRDTLEAALAVLKPGIVGGPDSLRDILRDSLARILRIEGAFQLLDTARLPASMGDSSSRSRLRCRTGAAFLVQSEFSLGPSGWRVRASMFEIATNRFVATLDYQDKSRRADRPLELAPWAARRLLGTETRAVAPARLDLPWTKIAKLGIPATVGILSVLLHL